MKAEEVEALRALSRAATPPPWTDDPAGGLVVVYEAGVARIVATMHPDTSIYDGGLIAAARNALPAILDEIATHPAALTLAQQEARAERDGVLRTALRHLEKMHDLAQYHVFEIESIASAMPSVANVKRSKRAWADYLAAEKAIPTVRALLEGK